jgi:hypothetical protein
MFSALPPKPDIARRDWHVRFGPTPEVIWVSGLQSKAYDKTVAMVVK